MAQKKQPIKIAPNNTELQIGQLDILENIEKARVVLPKETKEISSLKEQITLILDDQSRIREEIGGIRKDLHALKSLLEKTKNPEEITTFLKSIQEKIEKGYKAFQWANHFQFSLWNPGHLGLHCEKRLEEESGKYLR